MQPGRISAAYRAGGLDGGQLGAGALTLGVDPVQAALVLPAALAEAARYRTGLCLDALGADRGTTNGALLDAVRRADLLVDGLQFNEQLAPTGEQGVEVVQVMPSLSGRPSVPGRKLSR